MFNILDLINRQRYPEPLIAVMGGTGSGKSTFINSVVGQDIALVGHTLDSQTSIIQEYTVYLSERKVTLVDTPGFDDYRGERNHISDIEILEMLGKFLLNKYKAKTKFTAIIYIHNISEPRVGNVSHTHMQMFKALCGVDSMKNIIVVTTFWDRLHNAQEGISREYELETVEGFFKQLHDNGASFKRVGKPDKMRSMEGYDLEIPREIISNFNPSRKVYVAMQTELDKSGNVATTAAGRALQSLYGIQSKERMKKLDELNQELQTLQEENEGPSLLDVMSDLAQMREDLEYWKKKEDRLRGTFITSKPSPLQLLVAKLMRWR